MFWWAVTCGAFSYYIFILGLLGQLSYLPLTIGTAVFVLLSWYIWQHSQRQSFELPRTRFELIIWTILILQFFINIVGALGPELAFDALWYHLTIPRIWLMEGRIFYIEHGPFQYSLLPKVIDLLYIPALLLGNEIVAKLIHLSFGALSAYITYRLARVFLNKNYSLLATLLFYTNLVVGWQSITAYIDLGRTFFESLAVLALITFFQNKNQKWIIWTGVMLGLGITSKLIGITSLVACLFILLVRKQYKHASIVGFLAMLVPLPWFIFNWSQTGNPIFPIFSDYNLSSEWSAWDIVTIWVRSADPISPLYLISFPLVVAQQSSKQRLFTILSLYCLSTLVLWWLTPRTGGGRFLLPYLPAFSVLSTYAIAQLQDKKLQKFLISLTILLCCISVGYRAVANKRYLPVIWGTQSKAEFLHKNLVTDFGENWFYLSDENLKKLYRGSEQVK
jgi:4-amino-4-deoxy-L-arabinose transferase-like glycosyltransferase